MLTRWLAQHAPVDVFIARLQCLDDFQGAVTGPAFIVTFDEVRSYTALENDLGNEKNELSDLFFAAHNVITELRKIEENKHNKEN